MTEWDGHDLALLAPEVDGQQSRKLFDRRRSRRKAGRRAGVAVVTLAGLAVLVVGVYAWIDRSSSVSVETGVVDQPTDTDADIPEFEVLDVRTARDPMGKLRAAVNDAELQQLWSTVGYDDTPPDVDFDQWVLVTMTIPDDACPPTLTGFDRVGDTLTPAFVEPTSCQQPLIPKTFIVAIKRSTVTPSFTLRLPSPETPAYGYDEQLLAVEVSEVGAMPAPQPQPSATPCVRRDEAEVCLDHQPDVGLVGITARGLAPGSELTITNENNLIVYQNTDNHRANGLVSILGSPPAGQTLRLQVSGTTAAGNPLKGVVAVTTPG